MTTEAKSTISEQAHVPEFAKPTAETQWMRAVRVRNGLPEFTTTMEKPTIEYHSSQVLIKVKAAGVNPVDWKIARGDFSPLASAHERTGYDVAGVVEAAGDHVTRFKKGDAVWGDISPRIGTYAEYVVADDQNLDFKPEQLTFVEAAAVPLAALTAFQGLIHVAHLKAGDKVLILGGASGVGHFALQLARAHGAEVWATASETHKALICEELGCEHFIDYHKQTLKEALGSTKVDIVFDAVGVKESRDEAFDLLKPHTGHLVTTQPVDPAEKISYLKLLGAAMDYVWKKTESVFWRDVHYHAFTVDAAQGAKDLVHLRQLFDAGKMRPIIQEVLPLDKVALAWQHSQSLHTGGKIVLEVDLGETQA